MEMKGWQRFLQKAIPLPARVVLALMGFLAVVNAYTMRVCLSVAITEMVVPPVQNDTIDETCESDDESTGPEGGTFEWSQAKQGLILSSFFYGYVLTHVPGGLLAEKFGGKWVLCGGIFSTAIFTLITPVCIDYGGFGALIALRALEGFGEGTTFPALTILLAMWIPKQERSKVGALVYGGSQVGTILGNSLSGVMISAFDDWRACFYFFGVLGLLWVFFFIILCYNDPESHPFIKDSEKEFLKKELGQLERDKTLHATPWKLILTNAAVISLVVSQIGHDFGFFIMVTDLPKYMADVMRFKIKENGLYSSLPYVFMWITAISCGFLGDWLIKTGRISITTSRKMFTVIAATGPGIFIVAASYAGCQKTLVVVLFTIAMALMGAYYPGMKVNALDLSPNFAGTLMALTNGIAAFTGIISPYLVGLLTPNSYLSEWRIVFWLSFIVFNVTNIPYIIWASGEIQDFNYPPLPVDQPKKIAGAETSDGDRVKSKVK